MSEGTADSVEVMRSATGTLKRSGPWKVASRLEISSVTGAVKLDFREAVLPKGPVTIDVQTATGAIDLILPEGASADLSGLMQGTGHTRSSVPSQPGPAGPHFIVTGSAGTGAVRVDLRPKILGLF